MSFRLLYEDPYIVAIEKPAGFHVHPPEDSNHTISPSVNCLHILRNQLGKYLYPVHRLDRATSGVLLFGLEPMATRRLSEAFQEQSIKKTYFCVVRGWTEKAGIIDRPLRSDKDPEERLNSETTYSSLAQVELPISNQKYLSSRYSLLKVHPHTGRRHQIRRHLDSISHPLIGDTQYGNGEHNRIFKEKLKISGLLLKAYSIEFNHPIHQNPMKIESRWNGRWHQIFDLFGVCPFEG